LQALKPIEATPRPLQAPELAAATTKPQPPSAIPTSAKPAVQRALEPSPLFADAGK
jgi:hypothetical protein